MIATVQIEGKEITVEIDGIGAIIPTHVDGRKIDYRKSDPDNIFVEIYDDEIVKAVKAWVYNEERGG